MRKHLEDHGDVVRSEHASIDALVVDLHSVDVRSLRSATMSALVTLDSDVYNDAAAPTQANRNSKTSAPAVDTAARYLADEHAARDARVAQSGDRQHADGFDGIGVAIIDSGITPSANFNDHGLLRFRQGQGRQARQPPYDDYGHGTHVAGLIGSKRVLSNYAVPGHRP